MITRYDLDIFDITFEEGAEDPETAAIVAAISGSGGASVSMNDYRQRWRAGLITEDEWRKALVKSGISEAQAREKIAVEKTKGLDGKGLPTASERAAVTALKENAQQAGVEKTWPDKSPGPNKITPPFGAAAEKVTPRPQTAVAGIAAPATGNAGLADPMDRDSEVRIANFMKMMGPQFQALQADMATGAPGEIMADRAALAAFAYKMAEEGLEPSRIPGLAAYMGSMPTASSDYLTRQGFEDGGTVGFAGGGYASGRQYTEEELRAAIQRHFGDLPASEQARALWVINAESGGRDIASKFNAAGGESSFGPWQINLQAHPHMAGKTGDLDAATAYARQLYNQSGWQPWSVTHNNFAGRNGSGSVIKPPNTGGGGLAAAYKPLGGGAYGGPGEEGLTEEDRARERIGNYLKAAGPQLQSLQADMATGAPGEIMSDRSALTNFAYELAGQGLEPGRLPGFPEYMGRTPVASSDFLTRQGLENGGTVGFADGGDALGAYGDRNRWDAARGVWVDDATGNTFDPNEGVWRSPDRQLMLMNGQWVPADFNGTNPTVQMQPAATGDSLGSYGDRNRWDAGQNKWVDSATGNTYDPNEGMWRSPDRQLMLQNGQWVPSTGGASGGPGGGYGSSYAPLGGGAYGGPGEAGLTEEDRARERVANYYKAAGPQLGALQFSMATGTPSSIMADRARLADFAYEMANQGLEPQRIPGFNSYMGKMPYASSDFLKRQGLAEGGTVGFWGGGSAIPSMQDWQPPKTQYSMAYPRNWLNTYKSGVSAFAEPFRAQQKLLGVGAKWGGAENLGQILSALANMRTQFREEGLTAGSISGVNRLQQDVYRRLFDSVLPKNQQFAEGGSVRQDSQGRPHLTLNEPAALVGLNSGEQYAVAGEVGTKEKVFPEGNGMRFVPTDQKQTGPFGAPEGLPDQSSPQAQAVLAAITELLSGANKKARRGKYRPMTAGSSQVAGVT